MLSWPVIILDLSFLTHVTIRLGTACYGHQSSVTDRAGEVARSVK